MFFVLLPRIWFVEAQDNIFRGLGGVFIFRGAVALYLVADLRARLKVSSDMIDKILATCNVVPGSLSSLVVVLVVVVFVVSFSDFVVVCSAGHTFYIDRVLDSALYDAEYFRSDAHI